MMSVSPSSPFSRFPAIAHPSTKRLTSDLNSSFDVRGKSRDGFGNGQLIRSESSASTDGIQRRRRSSSLRHPSRSLDLNSSNEQQPRLPIFGQRPSSILSSSRSGVDLDTPRSTRIRLDELEMSLREKVRSQLNDVRVKFRHAADSNGQLSRSAFEHFIASIFGTQRQVSPQQIELLLQRLHLKQINQITFEEFVHSLSGEGENGTNELPSWLSREISPRREDSSNKRTATQVFLILKEKVRTKNVDLRTLCPSLVGGPPSRIFKAQLFNALIEMGYPMKDQEFDKLWDKFDTDGYKAVQSEKFLKRLTNESIGEQANQRTQRDEQEDEEEEGEIFQTIEEKEQTPRSTISRPPPPAAADENQIHKWLNHKFPQGFGALEKSLERLDTKQMGTLSRSVFLSQLNKFGLKLEDQLLEFFLKRLKIDLSLTNDSIPYRDVINAFKQQSDPTRKHLNADNNQSAGETRQLSLERQIDYSLSLNYDRVKSLFHRLDPSRSGSVSSNDLRTIIEDLLQYTLKADEFYQLLKDTPLDEHGRVIYKEYLKRVLDRALKTQEQQSTSRLTQWDLVRPVINGKEKFPSERLKRLRDQPVDEQSFVNDASTTNGEEQPRGRNIEELREVVKTLIRSRYKEVEEQFKKLDRSSYSELTPDLLFELFKRLSVSPPIVRSEVDVLWSRCHLKENGRLDFYQFLREFGYTKGSAHYPNAKSHPPRRGDADFLLTSRKLYGDSVLVLGTTLNAIRSNWNELRQEFLQLDPYRTGFIQSEEFDEILSELCHNVNQEDLHRFKDKFQTKTDSRMNYVKFLKHYSPLPEYLSLLEHSTEGKTILPSIDEHSPRINSNRSTLSQISNKIRRKLGDCYKALRRALKEKDVENNGSIPVKTFREILQKFKCSLNDEEFYTLVSQIDTRLNGTIDYQYFLQHYVKST